MAAGQENARIEKVVEGIKKIPTGHITRLLYEAIPWGKRKYFDRKIMSFDVKPLRDDMVVVGPAYTVGDAWMTLEMIGDKRKEGRVMVISSSGHQGAFIGALMCEIARQDGALGIITDGYVTHKATLVKRNFPVFCRGAAIKFTGYALKGDNFSTIMCGGVKVNPDDIVVGNADGVMVLTLEEAERLLKDSKPILKIVKTLTNRYMSKGIKYIDAPGVREFWKHKASGDVDEAQIYTDWCSKNT